MHHSAYVVLVVAHAETGFDSGRQSARGPPMGGQAMLRGTLAEDASNFLELISRKPAGTPGSPALLKRVDSFVNKRIVPA